MTIRRAPKDLLGQRIRVYLGTTDNIFLEGMAVVFFEEPCFEIQLDDGTRRTVGINSRIEVAVTNWENA